jgi:hypothetical protein
VAGMAFGWSWCFLLECEDSGRGISAEVCCKLFTVLLQGKTVLAKVGCACHDDVVTPTNGLLRTLLGEEATFCCVFSTSLISNAILYCELSRLLALLFGIKRSICTQKLDPREHESSDHQCRCNRSKRTGEEQNKHAAFKPIHVKYRA